jgi:hypothetical protein
MDGVTDAADPSLNPFCAVLFDKEAGAVLRSER